MLSGMLSRPHWGSESRAQALALTEYRSARLEPARIRAATHGYRGAMWPWESALTGFGAHRRSL
jgi:trehalose/maltose hydrolase-like predicted phosphorylase